MLGEHGMFSRDLEDRVVKIKKEDFGMTLIAASTDKAIVSFQLIEGGIDASLFENFIYQMLLQMRKSPDYEQKDIILLMDNAKIHR
jgi:hypothetical protein